MKKIVKSMGEKCKVSIRNIRRDGNDELKKLLKLKEISEDNEKKFENLESVLITAIVFFFICEVNKSDLADL